MAEDAPRADGRTGRQRAAALLVPAQAVALLIAIPLLFWGADALARLGAETLVARNLGVATGVIEPPDIEVRGRLFLPQVIRGSYEHVDVEIRGVTSGPLRVDRVDARLRGVRLPFHDVLVRDLGELGVVDSSTRVRLTYADLNSYFDQTGRPLQISVQDDGQLRLAGTVDVLGRRVDGVAVATISASNGTLRITPASIDTGDTTLGSASRLLLQQRFSLTIPLGSLPFGQEVTSVTPTEDALIVDTVGYGVVVGS